jgi:hypothetical protein
MTTNTPVAKSYSAMEDAATRAINCYRELAKNVRIATAYQCECGAHEGVIDSLASDADVYALIIAMQHAAYDHPTPRTVGFIQHVQSFTFDN